MRGLKRPRLLALICVLAALTASAVLIAQFVGAQQGGKGLAIGGPLLASNRTMLSLCVDGAGGATVAQPEQAAVREALEATLAAAPDVPSEYNERSVSRGCPTPLGLTGKVLDVRHRGPVDVSAPAIASPDLPSVHRLHIYFVPERVYAESFGGDAYAVTNEEVVCEGHLCVGITPALYVRQSVTADVLRRALRSLLGLLPLVPEATEYSEFCLSGTPEQWCYQYDYCEAVPSEPVCKEYGVEPTERPETPLSR